MDANTELTAIQAFSLVFLFLDAGEERYIENIGVPQDSDVMTVMPIWFNGHNQASDINEAIGKAFSEFKTN